MTRHRSLRYTPPAEQKAPEPWTFTIRPWDPDLDDIPDIGEGQTAQDRADELNEPRTFTGAEELPGIYVFDLGRVAAMDEGDPEQMAVLSGLLEDMVVEEDQERLLDQLRNIRQPGNRAIGVAELMWLLNEILEEVMGRPTEGQQASPTSLPSTPIGSTGDGENAAVTAV